MKEGDWVWEWDRLDGVYGVYGMWAWVWSVKEREWIGATFHGHAARVSKVRHFFRFIDTLTDHVSLF